MEPIKENGQLCSLEFNIMSEGITEHNARVHSYYEVIMYLELIRQSSTVSAIGYPKAQA